MDNYAIADQLSLLSKLMDIHGENAFKSKSYASAAYAIEKLPQELALLPKEKIASIKGIGQSVSNKVIELIKTGELIALNELIAQTPKGVLEMMNIKGLGPKKINTIWKDLKIDTIEELKEACITNKIAATKGFGEKTEQKILEAIHFHQQNQGSFLYAQVEAFGEALQLKLQQRFPQEKIMLTGAFRRQMEVIEILEWVTTIPKISLLSFFNEKEFVLVSENNDLLEFMTNDILRIRFFITDHHIFYKKLFITTGSDEFVKAWENKYTLQMAYNSEEEVFTLAHLPFIPPYLRELSKILEDASTNNLPTVLQTNEIKGLIHSHSNWSDGAHTIEEMATELINLGFEYLVISDHSKAAYYANGLDEKRAKEQHIYIDSLNKKLAPFKIFKSIECDILSDGSMDYSNDVLASFDLVIASIHSNLDMPEDKAMLRLMGAIQNPYVTIMGHLTGRLLTKRKGYSIDHKTIINACAANKVVIEINSSPNRLDMDWRWIDYALEKGVLLSVNPDAHSFEDFHNLKYGVAVAQKGGLTSTYNLSSFSLAQFQEFISNRKNAIQ